MPVEGNPKPNGDAGAGAGAGAGEGDGADTGAGAGVGAVVGRTLTRNRVALSPISGFKHHKAHLQVRIFQNKDPILSCTACSQRHHVFILPALVVFSEFDKILPLKTSFCVSGGISLTFSLILFLMSRTVADWAHSITKSCPPAQLYGLTFKRILNTTYYCDTSQF